MKRRLLLGFGALLVALGCAELTLRLVLSPYITAIYQLDEACLFRPLAGAAHYHHPVPPNSGPRVRVAIGADGYRCPDGGGPRSVPAGARRIVVFGDSYVMAEFSPWEQTLCAWLERAVEASLGAPVFVINAGASGAGPDQYVVRMAQELPRLDADLAIVVIYAGNDYGDLLRDKLYRVSESGTVVRNQFVISARLREQFAINSTTAIYRVYRRFRMHSVLSRGRGAFEVESEARWRETALGQIEQDLSLSREEYEDFVVARRDEVRFLYEDHYDADVAAQPDSDAGRYKVALMRGVLAEIAACARRISVPLLVVAVPGPVDVIDDYRGGIVDPQRYSAYRRSRLTDEVAAGAAAAAVPCIDLFGPFRARGAELYLLAPDQHWSDAGQAFAAKLVAERIATMGLSPPK